MPRDYFQVGRIKALAEVKPGAKVHVIGVCGVAMAQLAVLLAERGYQVSGSDKEFYEPMAGFLENSPVRLYRGYTAQNLASDVELAVIGNAVSYGHPEVTAVEERRVPYSIFPKLLYELVLKNRQSVTVTGTHGKTTTTALIASILWRLGLNPGYFIGGVANDFARSLVMGSSAISVVEGDEYDSAFFAKVPKFTFYQPDFLVITSIEFDHADIYPDLESIKRQFDALVKSLRRGARVVACYDDHNLAPLIDRWKSELPCKVISYGTGQGADARITAVAQEKSGQKVTAELPTAGQVSFNLPLMGVHNARNALAALLVCFELGLEISNVARAMEQFGGVKRRQEVRYEGSVTLIEDFAHHPTAVRETIQALRSRYTAGRLWAVFEPRSNTSRRRIFHKDYVQAFAGADRVVLCEVAPRAQDTGEELLDVRELAGRIEAAGGAVALPNAVAIKEYILKEARPRDVFLVMSNGSFGGLVQMLEKEFKRWQ